MKSHSPYKPLERTKIRLLLLIRILVMGLLIWSAVDWIQNPGQGVHGHSLFVTIHSGAMLLITFLPGYVEHRWKVEIPEIMEILFALVAAMALLLGEIGGLYASTDWWDNIVHTLTAMLMTIVAFSLVDLLNGRGKVSLSLSPFFVAVFAFCFSLSIGVFWEIVEYTVDGITGANMQRYMDSLTLVPFSGHAALTDTMQDFMLDALGAFLVSVLGFFHLRSRGKSKIWTIEPLPEILENEKKHS